MLTEFHNLIGKKHKRISLSAVINYKPYIDNSQSRLIKQIDMKKIYILLAAITLMIWSCSDDDVTRYAEMKEYHAESQHLVETDEDSVFRFSDKVDVFVAYHTDAAKDPLYPEIQANIAKALNLFTFHNEEGNGDQL